jgi:hypothetical protein
MISTDFQKGCNGDYVVQVPLAAWALKSVPSWNLTLRVKVTDNLSSATL